MLGNAAATATNPSIKFTGDTDTGLGRAAADTLSLITGGTEAFRVTSTKISGSAASTGSFGRVEATKFVGDGSGLSGLTSAAIETYNTSGNNRILTSVDSTTVQGEAGLTFDGTELRVQGDVVAENFIVSSSVTYMTQSFSSGSTIFGNTLDDTHQFTGSLLVTGSATITGSLNVEDVSVSNTITTVTASIQNINFSEGGEIKDVGGNITLKGEDGCIVTIEDTLTVTGGGFTVDGNGSIVSAGNITATGNISGSSTSTGSFAVYGNDFIPSEDDTHDLGSSTNEWKDLYVDGVAYIDHLNSVKADIGNIDIAPSGHNDTIRRPSGNLFLQFGAGASSKVFIGHESGVVIDDTTVSGSVTSTGSFGSLVVADKIQGDITVGGNLIVEGDTIQQQVANLNIEDRFILLNSGSASGDGGLIVQTESHTAGVVYGYDDDEGRWGFQQGTKLSATGSAIAPDAYASAVVTSDDANYQKNGNIRVEGGEIFIYVE